MASCCASGPRQEHAEIQRVEEAALADPASLLHQLRLHDRDLPSRTAEADEAKLQPEAERFAKRRVSNRAVA
jgi:hypothetical protein